MKGKVKVVKGRIEEATGALIGSDKLRVKGRKDQVVGRVTQAIEKGIQQTEQIAEKSVDKAKRDAKRTVDRIENRK